MKKVSRAAMEPESALVSLSSLKSQEKYAGEVFSVLRISEAPTFHKTHWIFSERNGDFADLLQERKL